MKTTGFNTLLILFAAGIMVFPSCKKDEPTPDVIAPDETVAFSLNCGSITNNGTLTEGQTANGVTFGIPYTGGDGGTHGGQTVSSTDVTGLTANLASGNFADGSDTLIYSISGTPSASGTAYFALNIGGQTCTISQVVATIGMGSVVSLNCPSTLNYGILTEGQEAVGVSSEIPYSGGNGGTHNGQSVSSLGVTGLTASLAPGTFANGNGTLTYAITGTASNSGTANFILNIGGQTCTINRTVETVGIGSILSLDCAGSTNNGTLTEGEAANGVSAEIPYSGGDGGTYSSQSVASSGVIGLTASLVAGNFVNGSGTLIYTIAGTPAGSGTANFALNIGGQTCGLNLTVAEAPLTIGENHQGGIIFYLDGNGGGLIASPSDQSTGAQWGCYPSSIDGANGEAIGTGYQNTLDIVAGCSESGIAARICNNLSLNGYDDWFLPSVDELGLIQQNLHLQGLGGFVDGAFYWSSTEGNTILAKAIEFDNTVGFPDVAPKDVNFRVRAVRAF